MSLIPASASAAAEAASGIGELPSLLRRWIQLQDDITVLTSEIKAKRTQSKALKDVILRIMESNNVAKLNVSRGAVVHKAREVAEKINDNFLMKHFKEFFSGDEERAKALYEYLDAHRTVVVKHDLKLHTARGGSGGDDDKSIVSK